MARQERTNARIWPLAPVDRHWRNDRNRGGAAVGSAKLNGRNGVVSRLANVRFRLSRVKAGYVAASTRWTTDERSFKEFTGGNFEFGADAQAVAITLAAQAKASTTGASAGASATKHEATTAGAYHKGMATFTIIKGGLMYEASLAGQKFSYTAR
jgi:hypothetical protein